MNNLPEGANDHPLNPTNDNPEDLHKKYRTVRITMDIPVWASLEMAEHEAIKLMESATGAQTVSAEVIH